MALLCQLRVGLQKLADQAAHRDVGDEEAALELRARGRRRVVRLQPLHDGGGEEGEGEGEGEGKGQGPWTGGQGRGQR